MILSEKHSSLLLTLLLFSCNGKQAEEVVVTDSTKNEKPLITFAVAGHTYGNSDQYMHSIYPPFLKKLKEDHQKHNFDFLFLTGDVVMESTDSNWNVVKSELDQLGKPWFIAPGNHDLDDSTGAFMRREKYGFFEIDSNLFLLLNTSNLGWTVDAEQKNELEDFLSQVVPFDKLFVFTHQLWWQRNAPTEFELDSVRPNSFALYDGPSDFWQDVFPYFDSTGIETWFFAGDLGADEKLESYYEDHHEQFHFYASGMGGGKADNYLIVEVYQNGHVDIEKVSF